MPLKVGSEIVSDPRISGGTICCMRACSLLRRWRWKESLSGRFTAPMQRYVLELHPAFVSDDTHNLLVHLQQMEIQAKARCERSVKDAIAREKLEKMEAAKEDAAQRLRRNPIRPRPRSERPRKKGGLAVDSPWLKCSDAARTLGRSRAVIERLARLGKIATKVEHGRVLYNAADVSRGARPV